MIANHNLRLGFEFFKAKTGLSYSDDFRCVMFIANRHLGLVTKMEHVGAAFAFSNFCGRTASFHVVVQDPAMVTKKVLREVFSYAFVVCGLEALVATIDSTNVKSANFAKKVGGTLIHTIKDGGLDGDMLYFQMLKSDCIWIKENVNGERLARAA